MLLRRLLIPCLVPLLVGTIMPAAAENISCTEVEEYIYCSHGHQEDLGGWTMADVMVAQAVTRGVRDKIAALSGGATLSKADAIIRYALNKEDRAPVILFLSRRMEPGAEEELIDALYVVEVFGKREMMWVLHAGGTVEEALARAPVQDRLGEIAQNLYKKIQ